MNNTEKFQLPAPRLFAILAREAPVGVILRRGPSRMVQLIRWDLTNDHLDHGQWLKGRVYERRCSLSPSGQYFLYFVTGLTQERYTGTMISKPPYFTALAYWLHGGHTWGGGGVFDDEYHIRLNHFLTEQTLAKGFELPSFIHLQPLNENSGKGEDYPVYYETQQLNGWSMIQEGEGHYAYEDMPYPWYFDPPKIFEKINSHGLRLQQIWRWTARKNRAFQEFDYDVLDHNNITQVQLENITWADWDKGDLVFVQNGCLYRLSCDKNGIFPSIENQFFKLIYNFKNNIFVPLKAPPEAYCW